MSFQKLALQMVSFVAAFLTVSAAHAELHLPKDWQLGLMEAASPTKLEIEHFHDFLLVIITAITLFVLALLLYVMVRFRRAANPNPSKTTHNVLLEVVWTALPVLILVVITIPSIRILYHQNQTADADMTIKATGYQWYWGYEYPDHGGFTFTSYMKPDEDLKENEPRLLQTDTVVVVPVNTKVRVLVTAADVLHAWAMPSFGVKKDAVPGRINETWFEATKTGTFFGQCSEICGTGHGFMPITVKVVTKEEFEEWVSWAKQEFASTMPVPVGEFKLAELQ